MSTFFGIFHTDHAPVNHEIFKAMESVMNHWRADKLGQFFDQGIALGNLALYLSTQSVNEKMPFTSGSYTIAGDIRLDNREEIIHRLGEQKWSNPNLPDSSLLLELYRRTGKDVVKYLIGDFAFSIWSQENNTLFCARDHLGVRPFYYYFRDDMFAFASEKKGILAISGVDDSINEDYCRLLMADLDTPREQTFYKHIRQLPAASTMTVDSKGIHLETYWELELQPVLRLKNDEDYFEKFRAIFNEAVQARIKTDFRVGVELSGGLDSNAILGVTSRLIADKNLIHTFSNVAPTDSSGVKKTSDEEEWINKAIQFNGLDNVHKIRTGAWRDIFETLDLELRVHGSPMPYGSSWMEPVRREMEKNGIRVALSGFGGDEFVTNQAENYFYDIFYEGDYSSFLKVCVQKKIPLMPAKMLLRGLLAAFGLNAFPIDNKNPAERCSVLLDKDLEERLKITNDSSLYRSNLKRSHKRMIIDIISRPWLGYRLEAEAGYAISHRLINCYPMLDLRVLNFFLAVPARIIGQPGISRAFFRNAMKGMIQEDVRLRMNKSVAASPFSVVEAGPGREGYLSWINEVQPNLSSGLLSEMDFDELKRRIDPGQNENNTMGNLPPGVSFHSLSMVRYFQKNLQ